MYQISILFFATLREKAGIRSIMREVVPGTTVSKLKNSLIEMFPNLGGLLDHCLVAINHEYQSDAEEIPDKAEIAFFPPVSGGKN